jgi:NADPH:quinone reductase-like Zn-dependent oxidoreductase
MRVDSDGCTAGGVVKAIRYHRYGPPEVLELVDVEVPTIGADELLVRVRAAGVNPLDFHFMRGTPYLVRLGSGLRRPRDGGIGVDLAGEVEAVGANVTGFAPGDAVFGARDGAFAEYVRIRHDRAVLPKPGNLTMEEAAAVPIAGFSALQALRDKAKVQPGHKVLVNGAGGGVGTFAVQLATAFGAQVTAVCSTGKVELARRLGAEHVIDYTREDYTRGPDRYDAIIDMAGSHSLGENRRALTRNGVYVGVGGPDDGQWIAPVIGVLKPAVISPFVSQRLSVFLARTRRDDLAVLARMLEAGQVTPVIDRTYPLAEAAEAIRYLEEGHAQGKVVLTI